MAAAATTSLPEVVGGERNYDYRFSWIRDSAFAMDALGRMGFREQVHQSLSWLLTATNPTHPRMEPLYALDGIVPKQQSELPLAGYRGTQPGAEGQLGVRAAPARDVSATCSRRSGSTASTATRSTTRRRRAWSRSATCSASSGRTRTPASGSSPQRRHYTASKLSAWGAFDRALGLYELGQIAPERRGDRALAGGAGADPRLRRGPLLVGGAAARTRSTRTRTLLDAPCC